MLQFPPSHRGSRVLTAASALCLVLVTCIATVTATRPHTHGAAASAGGTFEYRRDAHAGSTGVIDEKDIGEVVFAGHAAKIAGSVNRGKAVLRYHIHPAFEGLGTDLSDFFILVRFTDNGEDARVIVRLKRLDTRTGEVVTLFTMDSDDFPASDEPQFQIDGDTSGNIDFDQDDLWWAEVTLIKNGPSGRAEIECVEVSPRDDL